MLTYRVSIVKGLGGGSGIIANPLCSCISSGPDDPADGYATQAGKAGCPSVPTDAAFAKVQRVSQRRVLKLFQPRGLLLPAAAVEPMQAREHGESRFFLYFASLSPHAPYPAPEADIQRYASIEDKSKEEPEHEEGGIRVPSFANWPGKLKPSVVDEPVHMVDIMPTALALAGGKTDPAHPIDGRDLWPTLTVGKPSPNEDILISVEAFRGAVRKGDWKLVKVALLPGKTELFDLAKDPGEKTDVTDQHPEIVKDLEARLLAYAREQKPSEWIKAQPAFVGEQVKTVFDPGFDIDDDGLPYEKPALPR